MYDDTVTKTQSLILLMFLGYGYHHPTDDNSRLFTMFFLIFGVYFIFVNMSTAISAHIRRAAKVVENYNSMDLLGIQMSKNKTLMFWNIVCIIITLLVGAGIVMSLEDWTFIQSLYFALQTSTVR